MVTRILCCVVVSTHRQFYGKTRRTSLSTEAGTHCIAFCVTVHPDDGIKATEICRCYEVIKCMSFVHFVGRH
jgi:hypothetical protein